MTKAFNIIPAIDILNGQLVRLSQGSYSDVETYDITPIEIAKKEIKECKIPLIIKRKLPNGTFENWNVRDMIIPNDM